MNLAARFRRGLVDRSLNECSRWASHKIHMPNPFPGLLNFNRFPWQRDILNVDEGLVTVCKAAQMGFSIAGLVRGLYVVAEQNRDVLYVLPTQGLAGDFSKARLDGVIDLSPELGSLFKNVNSVGLKVTKKRANFYLRGSVSSRGLVSVPVSSAIIDEFDRCADNTYDLVLERLSGQEIKYLFALSTPTIPEFGIHKKHSEGTQEEFFFKCPSCGRREALRWPDNVEICGDYPGDPECGRSRYFCTQCGNTLPHESKAEWLETSIWVPSCPTIKGHRSFQINQMYSATVSPEELANAYQKSLLSDIAAIEFKNQKLGQPHVSEDARLTDELIAKACDGSYAIGTDLPKDSSRMVCMGIDVGTFLDCWIAEYKYDRDPGNDPYGSSRSRLLQATRVPSDSWNTLEDLMRTWQVRYAVIDFQPETSRARAFCKRFKGYASMAQYRKGTVGNEIKVTEDEYGIENLTIDRTVFMDMALRRFHHDKIVIPGNTPGVVKGHLKAPIRTYEYDELGLPRAVYKSVADDHFAHAAVYCEIAHFRGYTQSTGRSIKPGEDL